MQPSRVHQHLCCSPILHCLTPTIPFSTWLIFAIRKGNLPTGGKRAPISKAKAPAMLKCPHRGRNDVPYPMSSPGGLWWLHPHTRRAQGTEQQPNNTQQQAPPYPALGSSLWKSFCSEILSREIPNFTSASQILFTISFHLDKHNNIVNSRALSTQGMQCLPVRDVYLC